MKHLAFSALLPLAGTAIAAGALTDNLAAYWDFEGTSTNNPAATGGTAFNGVLQGNAALTGTPRVGSGALLLDGTGDYLDVTSNVDVNLPWTVSAWFRSTVAPAAAVREFVYESVQTASAGYAMSFGIREGAVTTDTAFQLFTDNTPGADANASYQVPDSATIHTWHHIISVFTPATATTAGAIIGYLDGVERYRLVIPINDMLVPANGFHIGSFRGGNDRFFTGSIDEVAIWSRGLSPAETLEAYNRGSQGQNLTVAKKSVTLVASPTTSGSVSGGGIYDIGQQVTVAAAAKPGFAFLRWDGPLAGNPASFSLTVSTDVTSTATFAEDIADDDGDGLTNYEEVVIYQTLPGNPDTDGDLIPDGAEVQITLTSPTASDAGLVSFVRQNLSGSRAGGIALSPVRIERNPTTGVVSLSVGLSGSVDQSSWQAIDLSSPSVSIVAVADGWTITFPAPSNAVNNYLIKATAP